MIDSDSDMAPMILSSLLNRDSVAPLHDVAAKLHQLATSCVVLLRVELRAQCLFYLVPALKYVLYSCGAEAVEADSRVIALNKVLTSFDEVLNATLSKVRSEMEDGKVGKGWMPEDDTAKFDPPMFL